MLVNADKTPVARGPLGCNAPISFNRYFPQRTPRQSAFPREEVPIKRHRPAQSAPSPPHFGPHPPPSSPTTTR